VTTKSGATREELALLDEWNNSMRFEAEISIPKDTKLNIGKVGPQTSGNGAQTVSGGGEQMIMPFQWDLQWINKITDTNTGKVYNSIDEFAVDFLNLATN
jgi:filamentous hemagglutinin